MKKIIKPLLVILLISFVTVKSVYFEKLTVVKSSGAKQFNVSDFARDLWDHKMPSKINEAIRLENVLMAIQKSGETAFEEYTNALTIGNYGYTLVKLDTVEIKELLPDEWITNKGRIAIEFINGNAIRDASGLVSVKDFPITSELNQISEELNLIVRNEVVSPLKGKIKKGDKVSITAALELHKKHVASDELEFIPVQIQQMR